MATPEHRPAQRDTPAPEGSYRQGAPAMESPESLNTRHRELRHEYRDLLENARLNKDVLTRLGSDALHLVMRRANALQQSVSRPREQAVDSELFSDLSDLGATKAAKLLRKSQALTPEDFLAAVKMAFLPGVSDDQDDGDVLTAGGRQQVDWDACCEFAAAYFPEGPRPTCMLGPMDITRKVRSTVQRVSRKPVGPVVNPVAVECIEDGDRREVDRHMQEMIGAVRKAGSRGQSGIPFPELVLNHRSFSQTVENIFTLCFLLKDNRLDVVLDKEMGMIVSAKQQRHSDQERRHEKNKKEEAYQFVGAIDYESWEAMKLCVRPEDCCMRDRGTGSVGDSSHSGGDENSALHGIEDRPRKRRKSIKFVVGKPGINRRKGTGKCLAEISNM